MTKTNASSLRWRSFIRCTAEKIISFVLVDRHIFFTSHLILREKRQQCQRQCIKEVSVQSEHRGASFHFSFLLRYKCSHRITQLQIPTNALALVHQRIWPRPSWRNDVRSLALSVLQWIRVPNARHTLHMRFLFCAFRGWSPSGGGGEVRAARKPKV